MWFDIQFGRRCGAFLAVVFVLLETHHSLEVWEIPGIFFPQNMSLLYKHLFCCFLSKNNPIPGDSLGAGRAPLAPFSPTRGLERLDASLAGFGWSSSKRTLLSMAQGSGATRMLQIFLQGSWAGTVACPTGWSASTWSLVYLLGWMSSGPFLLTRHGWIADQVDEGVLGMLSLRSCS